MPLSKLKNAHCLIPGKKYYIDVFWNINNNLREVSGYSTVGTFVENNYVRGRTHSYDSGLQVLLSRSRIETTFNINGINKTVSSANNFYEILTPPEDKIAQSSYLFTLPLHNDIKKYITKYIDYLLDKRYKPKFITNNN